MGVLAGIGFVAAAWAIGGWEWALIGGLGIAIDLATKTGWRSVFATVAVGLIWLALFQLTGDRRLFFPYSMQYAVQAACLLTRRVLWPVPLGAGAVVALFMVIRIWQQATVNVLAIELIVAIFVLGAATAAHRRTGSRLAAATLGSVLAFTGLIL